MSHPDLFPKAPPRPWAGFYSSIGRIDRMVWPEMQREYYWDRLAGAVHMMDQVGIGDSGSALRFYRLVQAEWFVRHHGKSEKIQDWLTFEWLPDEIDLKGAPSQVIEDAMDEVADQLGYDHDADTWLTVLAAESDASWLEGRNGYMVDKFPYDKICIPVAAFGSSSALATVVRHEYAHVAALNMAKGNLRRWTHEMVAQTLQGPFDPSLTALFQSGKAPWRNIETLDMAFNGEPSERHEAYAQTRVIGHYLSGLGGNAQIGAFLTGISNNSTWTEFKMSVTGQTHEDEALREVYGFGERELLDRAKP